MDNDKIYTTTVRLYKNRPMHSQAYGYLKQRNKDIFKSNDDFIAEAIIYYSRYLKREKTKLEEEKIREYLQSKDNFIFQAMQEIMTKLLDGKFQELYDKVTGSNIKSNIAEELADADKCSDSDQQFAEFYGELE